MSETERDPTETDDGEEYAMWHSSVLLSREEPGRVITTTAGSWGVGTRNEIEGRAAVAARRARPGYAIDDILTVRIMTGEAVAEGLLLRKLREAVAISMKRDPEAFANSGAVINEIERLEAGQITAREIVDRFREEA